MRFKYLFLVLVAMGLSGCSEFLKGKPAKETAIEIKQEAMSCLKGVSLEMNKFIKSESSVEMIEKTFNCIDSTLAQFQDRVEGTEKADSFNSDELFQIFDKFIKDSNISKKATADLLSLKAAMLGGSDQRITKAEISALRDFLLAVKLEAKNLLPYAQLFNFADKKTFPKNMIKSGFAQLNLSLKTLMAASKFNHSVYSYDEFKDLLIHLNFVDSKQAAILELADKVNDLIIGNISLDTVQDRELYIDNLTEVLRLYTMQNQGFVRFEITSPDIIDNTLEYVSDVIALLENSVQYKKSKAISVESLDPLITEIQKKDIFPVKLSLDTALTFYKTILVRVYSSGLNSDIKGFKGLEKIHFANIKREVAIYKLWSRLISQISDVKNRSDLKTVHRKISDYRFADQQDILKEFNQQAKGEILRNAEELKAEFLRAAPTIYRWKKLVLAHNEEIWDQAWSDLARSFYVMAISRQLVLGWGSNPASNSKEMKNSFISEQGIVQWYSEFRDFGVETKAFDPRVPNAGIANLRAANLFTRAGNGDIKMDFRETTEQLGILFTGGGVSFEEIYIGLKKMNCNLNEKDVIGLNWNNEACAKQEIRKNFKYYFSNMSYLVAFVNKLSDAEFSEFYDSIMEIARTDSHNQGTRLESSDLKTMSILFHYIESLFATYDKDNNLQLTEMEIKEAYPKFKVYAEAYAHKNSQSSLDMFNNWMVQKVGYGCYTQADLIKDGFVYLVLNAKSAGLTNLNIAPCMISQRPLMDLQGGVDRKGLINTFKILKSVLGS